MCNILSVAEHSCIKCYFKIILINNCTIHCRKRCPHRTATYLCYTIKLLLHCRGRRPRRPAIPNCNEKFILNFVVLKSAIYLFKKQKAVKKVLFSTSRTPSPTIYFVWWLDFTQNVRFDGFRHTAMSYFLIASQILYLRIRLSRTVTQALLR